MIAGCENSMFYIRDSMSYINPLGIRKMIPNTGGLDENLGFKFIVINRKVFQILIMGPFK